jgi:hypothetical protein
MGRLGLSSEGSLVEGEPVEVMEKKRRAYTEAVRPARLDVARQNPKWTELQEVDLVPRGRGYLVSAVSDRIYQRVQGVVFASYSVNVIADQTELSFYVDRDGELHFLEQIPGTWTQHLEKQAARQRRRAMQGPRTEPLRR